MLWAAGGEKGNNTRFGGLAVIASIEALDP